MKKLLSATKLLAATVGLLISITTTQSASANVFSFSREYDGSLQLFGQFTATDQNKDGFISASEIEEFEASLSSSEMITAEEEKEIEQFNHEIGTNNLSFIVRTTERGFVEPFWPLDLQWSVDFSGNEEGADFFLITDFIMAATDTVGTGQVEQAESIPEPTSLIAISIVTLTALLGKKGKTELGKGLTFYT